MDPLIESVVDGLLSEAVGKKQKLFMARQLAKIHQFRAFGYDHADHPVLLQGPGYGRLLRTMPPELEGPRDQLVIDLQIRCHRLHLHTQDHTSDGVTSTP